MEEANEIVDECLGNYECLYEISERTKCVHGNRRDMGIEIWSGNKAYCGLVDSGAQISLVNVEVVKEIGDDGGVISKGEGKVSIRGLGEG